MAKPTTFVQLKKDDASGTMTGFFIYSKSLKPLLAEDGSLRFMKIKKAKLDSENIKVVARVPKETMAMFTDAQKERVRSLKVGKKAANGNIDTATLIDILKAEMDVMQPHLEKVAPYQYSDHYGTMGLMTDPQRVKELLESRLPRGGKVDGPLEIMVVSHVAYYRFPYMIFINVEKLDKLKDVLARINVGFEYVMLERALVIHAGEILFLIGAANVKGDVIDGKYSIKAHDELDAASNGIIKDLIGGVKKWRGKEPDHFDLVNRALVDYQGDEQRMLAELRAKIANAPKGMRVKKQAGADLLAKAKQLKEMASVKAAHPLPVLHDTVKRMKSLRPGGVVSMDKDYEWTFIRQVVSNDAMSAISNSFAEAINDKGVLRKRLGGDDFADTLLYWSYFKVRASIPPGALISDSGAPLVPPTRANDLLPFINENGFTQDGLDILKASIASWYDDERRNLKNWTSKRLHMINTLKSVTDVDKIKATDAFDLSPNEIPLEVLHIVDLGTYHGREYSSKAATKEGWQLGASYQAGEHKGWGYTKSSGKLIKLLKGKEAEVIAYYDKQIDGTKKRIDKTFEVFGLHEG